MYTEYAETQLNVLWGVVWIKLLKDTGKLNVGKTMFHMDSSFRLREFYDFFENISIPNLSLILPSSIYPFFRWTD